MKKTVLAVMMGFLLVLSVGILPAGAYTIDIDLRDFYLEGGGSIISGSSASLEVTDPSTGYTLLENNPLAMSVGDPGIAVPAGAFSLSFLYDFSELSGNETVFFTQLFDGINGTEIAYLELDSPKSGVHSFDISSLSTNLLGLSFSLTEYGGTNNGLLVGSKVTISNLQLIGEQLPIPEPGTLLLLGIGLFAFSGMLRKRGR
ncbi:MAG: PEP-CTERM sorting domain-containing protein [Pseudomonadota bacterium]